MRISWLCCFPVYYHSLRLLNLSPSSTIAHFLIKPGLKTSSSSCFFGSSFPEERGHVMQNLHWIHLDALPLSVCLCQFNFQGPQKWRETVSSPAGSKRGNSWTGGPIILLLQVRSHSLVEIHVSTCSCFLLWPILVIYLIIHISNREFKKLWFTSVYRVNM